jgi:hypothetical protein
VDIDFTDAVWTSDEVVLDTYAVFGGVNVKVPAGVEVIDHTFAIFGGTSVKRTTPGTKRIIVKGFALFGGIDVKGPRTRRSSRLARSRQRVPFRSSSDDHDSGGAATGRSVLPLSSGAAV